MGSVLRKAPRSRKRWIASLLLVTVIFTSWWHWPRGDLRFVGKWACFSARPVFGYTVWNFARNGSGTIESEFSGSEHFVWRVDDDRIQVRSGLAGHVQSFFRSLPGGADAKRLGTATLFCRDYKLTVIPPNQLLMAAEANASVALYFTRFPE